jgi:two-component system OmpR family response regulator
MHCNMPLSRVGSPEVFLSHVSADRNGQQFTHCTHEAEDCSPEFDGEARPGRFSIVSGAAFKLGSTEDRITIVYVEDDERLARLTSTYLRSHDIETFVVTRGDRAVSEVLAIRPDAVVLDLNLPRLDGLEVCRALRKHVTLPILMVTARTEEADRVMGLEGGADDYVSKPFSPVELLARLRAHVRRARGKTGPRAGRLEVGTLVVDADSMRATLDRKPISLTPHEFSLLRALAERAGRVLAREEIMQLASGTAEESFDRSVDVHISRLRRKLGDDPKNPRLLKTVRGIGYMLMRSEA